MIFTSIFKLRKPEGTDPVDIADINGNMDIIEMALNSRPEKTGNASEMTTIFSEEKEVKVLVPGETLRTSLGKIAGLVTDYISFKKEVGEGSGAVSEALGGLKFGQDANGNWGYILPDTTEVIPFGRGESNWNGEIENADWVKVSSGVYSSFTRAVFRNGYLAAITADGTVVYTTDGENWKRSRPEYQDCSLTDIDWDGGRFLLTGSYTDGTGKTAGLILTTDDWMKYRKISVENSTDSETDYDTEYCAVYPANGKYVIVAKHKKTDISYHYIYVYVGDLENEWTEKKQLSVSSFLKSIQSVKIVKNSAEMLMCVNYSYNPGTSLQWSSNVYKINDSGAVTWITEERSGQTPQIHVLECRDVLYYYSTSSAVKYKLVKVLASNEQVTVSTDQNYAFADAVYFNEDEIFINAHSMLTVKKGESISDKTVADLVEIAPEDTMTCITRAFGRPYIFGNRGLVMKPV